MKALVIYDSAFGNTAKVAQAIGEALAGRYEVNVQHLGDVTPAHFAGLDLLVVGSPTQKLGMTETMRDFLDTIPDIKGLRVAAFDTRISIDDWESTVSRVAMKVFLHRYAAKPIERALEKKGGQPVIEPEGFFVLDTEGPLKEGELERAAAWASEIKMPQA